MYGANPNGPNTTGGRAWDSPGAPCPNHRRAADVTFSTRVHQSMSPRAAWAASKGHGGSRTTRQDADLRRVQGSGPGSHAVRKSPPGPKTHNGYSAKACTDRTSMAFRPSIPTRPKAAVARRPRFAICSVFKIAKLKPNVKVFFQIFYGGAVWTRKAGLHWGCPMIPAAKNQSAQPS